jgi:hypothetical protein
LLIRQSFDTERLIDGANMEIPSPLFAPSTFSIRSVTWPLTRSPWQIYLSAFFLF